VYGGASAGRFKLRFQRVALALCAAGYQYFAENFAVLAAFAYRDAGDASAPDY
jgi:hypothetical protein